MNRDRLELHERGAQVAALESFVSWQTSVCQILVALVQEPFRSHAVKKMEEQLSLCREDLKGMAFPDLSPEQSDALAAATQEQFDVLVRNFKSSISPFSKP